LRFANEIFSIEKKTLRDIIIDQAPDGILVLRIAPQGYVKPGSESLDNLKEDSGGSKATFEYREAYDISSMDEDATFPDVEVPEFRENFAKLLPMLTKLADGVFR
jgi:hypothetical protein